MLYGVNVDVVGVNAVVGCVTLVFLLNYLLILVVVSVYRKCLLCGWCIALS